MAVMASYGIPLRAYIHITLCVDYQKNNLEVRLEGLFFSNGIFLQNT